MLVVTRLVVVWHVAEHVVVRLVVARHITEHVEPVLEEDAWLVNRQEAVFDREGWAGGLRGLSGWCKVKEVQREKVVNSTLAFGAEEDVDTF